MVQTPQPKSSWMRHYNSLNYTCNIHFEETLFFYALKYQIPVITFWHDYTLFIMPIFANIQSSIVWYGMFIGGILLYAIIKIIKLRNTWGEY